MKWVFFEDQGNGSSKILKQAFFFGEKVLIIFLDWILFSNSYTFPSSWKYFAILFLFFLPCFGMLGLSLTSPRVLKKVWSNLSMATNFISN
jgi:hypothetical protein